MRAYELVRKNMGDLSAVATESEIASHYPHIYIIYVVLGVRYPQDSVTSSTGTLRMERSNHFCMYNF